MPEEEHTCSPWARTCNAISLAGWVFLQFHIGWQLLLDSAAFVQSDITFDVYILKPLQLFQLLDIVLILMGQSKGSLLGSIFQITGRLIVALIFVETATNPVRFALMVLCWSIAEVTRYLYYLFKSIPLIGLLRYHVFLVMYPLGAYAEMTLINDYIKRHAETLEDW